MEEVKGGNQEKPKNKNLNPKDLVQENKIAKIIIFYIN
jgi:hypothetical protein